MVMNLNIIPKIILKNIYIYCSTLIFLTDFYYNNCNLLQLKYY